MKKTLTEKSKRIVAANQRAKNSETYQKRHLAALREIGEYELAEECELNPKSLNLGSLPVVETLISANNKAQFYNRYRFLRSNLPTKPRLPKPVAFKQCCEAFNLTVAQGEAVLNKRVDERVFIIAAELAAIEEENAAASAEKAEANKKTLSCAK